MRRANIWWNLTVTLNGKRWLFSLSIDEVVPCPRCNPSNFSHLFHKLYCRIPCNKNNCRSLWFFGTFCLTCRIWCRQLYWHYILTDRGSLYPSILDSFKVYDDLSSESLSGRQSLTLFLQTFSIRYHLPRFPSNERSICDYSYFSLCLWILDLFGFDSNVWPESAFFVKVDRYIYSRTRNLVEIRQEYCFIINVFICRMLA